MLQMCFISERRLQPDACHLPVARHAWPGEGACASSDMPRALPLEALYIAGPTPLLSSATSAISLLIETIFRHGTLEIVTEQAPFKGRGSDPRARTLVQMEYATVCCFCTIVSRPPPGMP